MRSIFAVYWREEQWDLVKGENGVTSRKNPRHGLIGTSNILAKSKQEAENFIRGRHTTETTRPLSVNATVLVVDFDAVLNANPEPAPADASAAPAGSVDPNVVPAAPAVVTDESSDSGSIGVTGDHHGRRS